MSLNLPLQRQLAVRLTHFETLQNEFDEHQRVFEEQKQSFLAHQKAFQDLKKAFEERKKYFESHKRRHRNHKRKTERKFRHSKIDPAQNEQIIRSYQSALSTAQNNSQTSYAESLARDLAILEKNSNSN